MLNATFSPIPLKRFENMRFIKRCREVQYVEYQACV